MRALLLALALLAPQPAAGLVAKQPTPLLGFSTWNCFEGRINETEMRSVADAMVSNGLVAAGYTVSHLPSQWLPDVAINSLLPLNLCPPRQYLNIDDLWAADQRNAQGEITEDLIKFPSGMPALAKYLKSRGMHLGL